MRASPDTIRLDFKRVIGVFRFIRPAKEHDEALPALDALIIPLAASVISDAMVEHKFIQQVMGHADFSTTMDIYTHITQESMKEKAEVIKDDLVLM